MTVFSPKSEAELAEYIATNFDPILIQGGGTKGVHVDGHVVNTSELSGIVDYEPGALTMIAKAGTPLSEIQAALDKEGQRLSFEPVDYSTIMQSRGTATIGGVFATNNSGSRRFQSGAARDFLLGVRFVDGQGKVLKNGGRVMKNVTGYDLVKLLAGSWGTLGVLTEVAFKTLPKSETQTSIVVHGLDNEAAVRAMTGCVSSPFEVSGAVHLPFEPEGAKTVIRVEGFEGSVAYRVGQLHKILGHVEKSELNARASDDFWHGIRCLEPLGCSPDAIWKISVKPTDGPIVFANSGLTHGFFDWSGGLIWGSCDESVNVRDGLSDGHATLLKGGAFPKFHPENELVAQYSAKIREKFDPRRILNKGLMG